MTEPAPTELVIVIDSVTYRYAATGGAKRDVELRRVAKLLAGTRERLDAKLDEIRNAEALSE